MKCLTQSVLLGPMFYLSYWFVLFAFHSFATRRTCELRFAADCWCSWGPCVWRNICRERHQRGHALHERTVRQFHFWIQSWFIGIFTRLKSRGVDISANGVSVKTSKRFDRGDYVDATQRWVLNSPGWQHLTYSYLLVEGVCLKQWMLQHSGKVKQVIQLPLPSTVQHLPTPAVGAQVAKRKRRRKGSLTHGSKTSASHFLVGRDGVFGVG